MITIEAEINAPIETVWNKWTDPHHIINWNFAGDDWHCPKALVDLCNGGRFNHHMAARDGSFQFDFGGIYEVVVPFEMIKVVLDDGRTWITKFESTDKGTLVTESFEPEHENPEEMQRQAWQMILDRFKAYAEYNV